jgi:death-on-curing protein
VPDGCAIEDEGGGPVHTFYNNDYLITDQFPMVCKGGILSKKEITAREIIEIHADILRDFGGTSGIRDTGTLDYVIYQVNRSREVTRKSVIILHGIATGHPFVDGNKRTAFVAADNLVRDQGYQISATDEEVVSFMIEVAEYKHTRESVEAWIKEKTGL